MRADHAFISKKAERLHIQKGTEQMSFDPLGYLQEKQLEFIDKRASGGTLWIVGGTELAALLEELKAKGIIFTLAPEGGRASRHRPAWFTKWAATDAE